MQVKPSRSYRCRFHPKDPNGFPVPNDTGVLPFIQVKATNAEHAQVAAHAVTGCPITSVERVEGAQA